MERSIILNNTEIQHKIRRMAFQIYETNANQKEVVIAGIANNGFVLAKKLKEILEEISPIKATVCEVIINKKKPLNPVETSLQKNEYKNKSLVLVDDVLNSGTTLMYAVKHFLEVPLKQFKTAVLVNRNHKKYPIKADFKGLSLSTSLQEHIALEIKGNKMVAYLD
ncbi:phosphoribosyltransferase family protein [Aureibaculum sp. 2210JD6-5]|uniref:phosphoribosyltransferase family protein n=1 Tax=Aureibaculum sp. 2210JD6-5 TaxID=3103957 RepID=UPI002AAD0EDE|nr:phosphoribosyltransferase family protein [Aureibaculum sp. 2210JD6-5]MDY7396609.1 phosphoribosyltransferase family protein [Aureibaculum sp. 2210JD6-5]